MVTIEAIHLNVRHVVVDDNGTTRQGLYYYDNSTTTADGIDAIPYPDDVNPTGVLRRIVIEDVTI